MAQWVLDGAAPSDLWDVDIRRFAPFTGNRQALAERTAETLGLHYAMRWPRAELTSARPLRTSPLYDTLAAQGAEFGSKNGWERANYFKPAGAAAPPPTLGRPGWLPWVMDEMRATREGVALYDQTSFGKLLLQGRDALAVLQHLCANDVDVPVGRLVYTAMLNESGGFESDLTVLRLPRQGLTDRFLIITGSAQPVRDSDWILRHLQPTQHAVLTDVSALWCVLSVMGPRPGAQLGRAAPAFCDPPSPHAMAHPRGWCSPASRRGHRNRRPICGWRPRRLG
jgi:4-methylaminobutanoate oxidase (formaldehyde-forming)